MRDLISSFYRAMYSFIFLLACVILSSLGLYDEYNRPTLPVSEWKHRMFMGAHSRLESKERARLGLKSRPYKLIKPLAEPGLLSNGHPAWVQQESHLLIQELLLLNTDHGQVHSMASRPSPTLGSSCLCSPTEALGKQHVTCLLLPSCQTQTSRIAFWRRGQVRKDTADPANVTHFTRFHISLSHK